MPLREQRPAEPVPFLEIEPGSRLREPYQRFGDAQALAPLAFAPTWAQASGSLARRAPASP